VTRHASRALLEPTRASPGLTYKQRKKFAGTNASKAMSRLEIEDTQRHSNGGDGTTANKLTSTIQEKGMGKTYSITAAKHEQNATLGKYHTYNSATKEWELDDENLGKATRKDSDNNGHGGPGGHGKAKDNTNSNSTQSFSSSNSQASGEKVEIVGGTDKKPRKAPRKDSGDDGHDGHGGRGKAKDNTDSNSTQSFSSSNSQASGEKVEIVGGTDKKPRKAPRKDSGDDGHDGHGGRGKAKDNTDSNSTQSFSSAQSFSSSNNQDSGEKVEIVSGINETDDEKVEILFGWYTGPGFSHSSDTLRETSTANQKSGSGKNQVESGKNQDVSGDKGQVGNASTAKRCTGVRSKGNGATVNEGEILPPQTPASTPTKNGNVKTLVENQRDCGGCIGISANGSTAMLVETSKINQKSGRIIEDKTMGHGGTQADSCNKVLSGIKNVCTAWTSSGDTSDRFNGTIPDTDSLEDGSNKSNASTGKNQVESGKNQGKLGKNQVESGKNQDVSGDKGQVGNASTAKRCTGVRSNGNGAIVNEGEILPPQTPASTPTKNGNVKTLVENQGDSGKNYGTSTRVPTKEPTQPIRCKIPILQLRGGGTEATTARTGISANAPRAPTKEPSRACQGKNGDKHKPRKEPMMIEEAARHLQEKQKQIAMAMANPRSTSKAMEEAMKELTEEQIRKVTGNEMDGGDSICNVPVLRIWGGGTEPKSTSDETREQWKERLAHNDAREAAKGVSTEDTQAIQEAAARDRVARAAYQEQAAMGSSGDTTMEEADGTSKDSGNQSKNNGNQGSNSGGGQDGDTNTGSEWWTGGHAGRGGRGNGQPNFNELYQGSGDAIQRQQTRRSCTTIRVEFIKTEEAPPCKYFKELPDLMMRFWIADAGAVFQSVLPGQGSILS
jgi:hypothetical protein